MLWKPHKIQVLFSFSDDTYIYQVSDHFYEESSQYNTRDLAFKNERMPCYYLHSSVYLDKSMSAQPIYIIPQSVFGLWNDTVRPIEHALVLGCAGCTIPRFLVLRYPSCKVDGVDYSKQMCNIAREYFFIPEFEDRFSLFCEDAFSFLSRQAKNVCYDTIFTDLFVGNTVIENVFTQRSLLMQFQHMAEQSILLINLLDVPLQQGREFSKMAKRVCDKVLLLRHCSHLYMILAKANNSVWDVFTEQLRQEYEQIILV